MNSTVIAIIIWETPKKKGGKMLKILTLSTPLWSIILEFLNLKGWFTTYLANASPYLISISLFKCIISEERKRASTIIKDYPGFI
jgi:hypothetical protein